MLEVQLMKDASSAEEFDVVGSGMLSMMNSTMVKEEEGVKLTCVRAMEGMFQVAEGVECVSKFYCGDGTGSQKPEDE